MSWRSVSLPTICHPKQWPTIPKAKLLSSGYPVFGANGRIGHYSEYNHEEATILITCRGATCGTINVCEPKSYVTGNAMALDALDESQAHLRFLVHTLKSTDFSRVITGVAQPQITRQSLARLQIPLPPLVEQKRIAGILDAADALRAKRRESLDQLDTLLQSTFLDMFGDPVTNPKGWQRSRMEDLTSKVTKGTTPTTLGMDFATEGVPFIRVQNLVNGRVDFSRDALFIDRATHEALRRSQIERRDILISIAGTIGRTAIVHSASALNCNQAVAILRPREEAEPDFLLHWLATEDAQRQMKGKRVTATISNLSLTQIKSLEVPAVPLDLQRRFADIVESVEQQKTRQQAHLAELDTLFASLQSRAFNGDL